MNSNEEKVLTQVEVGKYSFRLGSEQLGALTPLFEEYKRNVDSVQKLENSSQKLTKELEQVTKEKEILEGQVKALEEQKDQKADFIPKEEVKRLIVLIQENAERLNCDASELWDLSDLEIKKKAIKFHMPNLDIESMTSEQIDGAYIVASSMQKEKQADSITKQKQALQGLVKLPLVQEKARKQFLGENLLNKKQ